MVAQAIETVESFPLRQIVKDASIQPRVAIDADTVSDYAERMADGDKFPPVVLFRDDDHPDLPHYLADGWHRVDAAEAAGLENVRAEVRAGSKHDAALWAAGANARHGLRRSNGDKRKAVGLVLDDELCAHWTNREVAEAVGVSHTFVGNVRHERELGNVSKLSTPDAGAECHAADSNGHHDNCHATAEPDRPKFVDGCGNPVPPALEPVWQGLGAWEEFWNSMTAAVRKLNSLRGTLAGGRIRDTDRAALKQLRYSIIDSRKPFCVCPADGCRGEVGRIDCVLCKGSGWIVQGQYRNLPSELKWPGEPDEATEEGDDSA